MVISILLPTKFIDVDNELKDLPKDTIASVEADIVSYILSDERGVIKETVTGYYRSNTGLLTVSEYIKLTTYTSDDVLFNIIVDDLRYSILKKACIALNQESIGLIANLDFISVRAK